jgi:hypothetical protein
MWDDVIIGEGNKGCSATLVRDLGVGHGHISQNRVAYWISDVYLDGGMTIFTDTPEAQTLADLLSTKADTEVLEKFLIGLFLENIAADRLKSLIDSAIGDAFRTGAEAKTAEVRRCLGLY